MICLDPSSHGSNPDFNLDRLESLLCNELGSSLQELIGPNNQDTFIQPTEPKKIISSDEEANIHQFIIFENTLEPVDIQATDDE